MLFEEANSAFNNFPNELKKIINNIDINKPLCDIFNELFSFLETAMDNQQYFEPYRKIYCGFSLQDIKEPLFICLMASLYLYLEEKFLTDKSKEYQRDLLYMDKMEKCSPDPSKRISRNKDMIQKKLQDFSKDFDSSYYQGFLQILNLKSNPIIRSLELTHFLFADQKIRNINKNISKRFDLKNFSKLSLTISEYIQNPTSYHYGNIPITPEMFLAIDFENAFHMSFFNQVLNYYFYIYEHSTEVPLKADEFLCIIPWLAALPPYWLKNSETAETIIDNICKYVLNYNFYEAFKRISVSVNIVLTLIHYPLEASLSYILRKKYKSLSHKTMISEFLKELRTAGLKVYTDSVTFDQFCVRVPENELDQMQNLQLLVNALAFLPNKIDFSYNEYNMFYILGKLDIFSFVKENIDLATSKNNREISNNNKIGKYYFENLYTLHTIYTTVAEKSFIKLNMERQKYLLNFPENILFANRIKYLDKQGLISIFSKIIDV